MYLSVMDRSKVILEVLNREFFKQIMHTMEKETKTISLKLGDKILGSAMLAKDHESLVFLLVGLDYAERDTYDVYFNLIYAILSFAIRNKVKRLDLGQTSYYIKQRIGGKCIPMFFYIKSRKRMINWLLRRFQTALFPVTKLNKHKVFNPLA